MAINADTLSAKTRDMINSAITYARVTGSVGGGWNVQPVSYSTAERVVLPAEFVTIERVVEGSSSAWRVTGASDPSALGLVLVGA